MVAKGRGGGKTPERVVDLLRAEVTKTSQAATARATGLALQSVQNYIKGIGEPSQATLEKLSEYFGKSVSWLRGGLFAFDANLVGPVALCAECGNELQASDEGFHRVLPDGSEDDGDGILRLWPCSTCCKGK
jgi:transcriptional regulator with XRE-family HTH domain